VKLNSGLNFLDHQQGTRPKATKTKIVPGQPDEVFADAEYIHKNTRDTAELARRKTEKHMTTEKRGTRRGKGKHKGL